MDKTCDKLITNVMQTWRTFNQIGNSSFEEKHRTILHLEILNLLISKPGLTTSEFAKQLKMSNSSITQAIKRLVKDKLVKIECDKTDRRIKRLSITLLGQSEVKKLQEKIRERMKKILCMISESDVAQLIRIHQKMLKALIKQNK